MTTTRMTSDDFVIDVAGHSRSLDSRALWLVDWQQQVVVADSVALGISICMHPALQQPVIAAIDACSQGAIAE